MRAGMSGVSGTIRGSSDAETVDTSSRTPAQRRGDAAEALVAERLGATPAGRSSGGTSGSAGRRSTSWPSTRSATPASCSSRSAGAARRDFGLAEETFDRRKRGHLRVALGRLLELGRLPDGQPLPATRLRVDLVVVEPGPTGRRGPRRVRHHRDALAG